MKRLPILVCFLFGILECSGCQSKNTDTILALEKKVKQLEASVETLETEVSKAKANETSNSVSTHRTSSNNNMEGLTASVHRTLQKLKEATPAESEHARMEQYFSFKNQLKQLHHNIDAYDDNLQLQYQKELLSYTDYKIQERDAKALQEQLPLAANDLKTRFRIDE
ncbi:MAG: hypothetical protein RR496_00815 [Lachnospiraceae bacterium]